jgi:hypothetical protein
VSYRIYLGDPSAAPVPCTFVPSTANPGKLLSVNENGWSLVVLPNGQERPTAEPPGPNWDSPWTWGDPLGDLLIYRSADAAGPGVPRGYRMAR